MKNKLNLLAQRKNKIQKKQSNKAYKKVKQNNKITSIKISDIVLKQSMYIKKILNNNTYQVN